MSGNHRLKLAALIVAGAMALAGCATESPADQTPEDGESAAGAGLFERIFEDEPVTIPAGTLVTVEFPTTLSSADSSPGQAFEVRVAQDVAIDGEIAIPSSSRIVGSVTEARGPNKVGGRSRLSLEFRVLELASGESIPINASFARVGRSETPKDAAIIGGSTLGGAILGEAIDEGEGTVVGGVVGAIGGVVGAIKTKGKPVTVPAGTRMSLQLDSPVVID